MAFLVIFDKLVHKVLLEMIHPGLLFAARLMVAAIERVGDGLGRRSYGKHTPIPPGFR
jgi:hypothetical protein